MSKGKKDASEMMFQEKFVKELQSYKWEAPKYLDGNKSKVTVSHLIENWRNELNRINADQLEGVELSDNEFKQVLSKVNQISNSYEAAKLLAIEESTGKIDGIFRDNHPGVIKKQITLTIFKKAQVRGGDSKYQIAREVETSSGNRFDIVLLINGLPLINIEQKRTDKSLDEAYGQFMRYYKDGEYTNNFMAFSQMMVITTELETKYFATPKSIDDFNPCFLFHWSDKNNKRVNQWQQVIESFLMIPMAHQMVGDYLVIDEATDKENRRHMLMRPYQVYALQAVEGAAFGWDTPTKEPHGGFVWHTTGSGKTITSFKTALFLSTRGGFDKVIFLVDRRELDNRTSDNFKSYAAYEAVTVDDTPSTYQLKKRLQSPGSGIIVTTTFKLNSLVKELEEVGDDSLSYNHFVFIIDEAHRTTMGHMMGSIKNHFKRHGLFYGFTGTPLFDENNVKGKVNEKSELINTTEKLFGPKLHQYTIDEAISDGNVLGFNVDYINTGEFSSYEQLKDNLVEVVKLKKPDESDRTIERTVQSMTDLEVEKAAAKEGILIYQDETHIPRVVTEILENWDSQSQNKEFNAILTVAYKNRVIAYFDEFKKQLADRGESLNLAMTFSFGNENEPDNVTSSVIEKMFKDYAEFTGIEFVAGHKKHGEEAYFEDVIDRATRGGSSKNSTNIDLVIVADQLLTGYDSKRLNTLYVDRSLEKQGLVQAYSRTNRVFGKTKEFGSIINFRYPAITAEIVDDALKLYGDGGKSVRAIVDLYDVAVEKLNIKVQELTSVLSEPSNWPSIKDDDEKKKEFKEAFLDTAEQLNKVAQYYEFIWDDEKFSITEHRWLQYVGAYKNLFPVDIIGEPEVVKPLVGKTKLQGTQVIDAAHILKLITEKVDDSGDVQVVDTETLRLINEEIQELSDMGENEQAKLLKEFVDTELLPGNISANIKFDESFEKWKQAKLFSVIDKFAANWGIDYLLLRKSYESFTIKKPDAIPYIEEITTKLSFEDAKDKSAGSRLIHVIKLSKILPKWMRELSEQFR